MKKTLLPILILLTLNGFSQTAQVIRVIDGDTFETETGERVRLLGIDAPEMGSNFGDEAKEHLRNLIEGKVVDMKPDHISKDRDIYDRLLRYVYLNDSDINKQMIDDGFAPVYLKYSFDKEEEYKRVDLIAEANHKGLREKEQTKMERKDNASSFPIAKVTIISLIAILLMIGFYYYFKK